MSEKKKVRIGLGTFDLIKGIAILSVVVGHAVQGHPGGGNLLANPLSCLLGSLMCGLMPMFFIINGYGFRKKPVKIMLKKTFSELVVPYLVAIPIATVLHFFFFWKLYPDMQHRLVDAEKRIITFFLGTDSAGPLWFLLAMFLANNLLNVILKVKKESIQALFAILCVAVGFIVMQFNSVMQFDHRSFRIIEGLTAVGFCYFGYILKEKKVLGRMMYSVWSYIILIAMCMIQFWGALNGRTVFDMATAKYSVLSYICAGATGVLLLFGGLFLNKIKWDWLEFVRKCGMYSYWILIVHTVDYLAVPWWNLWEENPSVYLAFVIELGLRILIITTGCDIIKKITQVRYKNKMEKSIKAKQCVVAKLPE